MFILGLLTFDGFTHPISEFIAQILTLVFIIWVIWVIYGAPYRLAKRKGIDNPPWALLLVAFCWVLFWSPRVCFPLVYIWYIFSGS